MTPAVNDALRRLVGDADARGWQAHRDGRPDLRDTHWRYRDAITVALNAPTGPVDAHRTRTSTPQP